MLTFSNLLDTTCRNSALYELDSISQRSRCQAAISGLQTGAKTLATHNHRFTVQTQQLTLLRSPDPSSPSSSENLNLQLNHLMKSTLRKNHHINHAIHLTHTIKRHHPTLPNQIHKFRPKDVHRCVESNCDARSLDRHRWVSHVDFVDISGCCVGEADKLLPELHRSRFFV